MRKIAQITTKDLITNPWLGALIGFIITALIYYAIYYAFGLPKANPKVLFSHGVQLNIPMWINSWFWSLILVAILTFLMLKKLKDRQNIGSLSITLHLIDRGADWTDERLRKNQENGFFILLRLGLVIAIVFSGLMLLFNLKIALIGEMVILILWGIIMVIAIERGLYTKFSRKISPLPNFSLDSGIVISLIPWLIIGIIGDIFIGPGIGFILGAINAVFIIIIMMVLTAIFCAIAHYSRKIFMPTAN